ncbi:Phenol hydroxylase, FAD-and [2Fe-2S]-containing reductase component DmpP [Caballeronia glathei]|jgi:phenol hydroxylase P5 protein|uniref:Phenol hydroxylase n=1 Tax=Caballeronia glathei TaxID=60547 RepID=A0A069PPS4_9BURK|nr:phenol 2-monooxygenase domain-containing protein [Caballeronia glathei]KDR39296.1 phenol hydroxylase [Caballeronia glathei]CDY79086.1 Phenol hydroxylase, FAD-and [2Fe-2S]-containing reductase component DmpP [Caballeronia glathei]
MSYQLTIEPIGQTIEIGDDQTILDACMRAGVWLPHACCHGLCATCKVQVLDGEIEHGHASPFALMDFERDERKCLACCATAQSDITIEADVDEDVDARHFPVRDHTGRVKETIDLTPTIKGIFIELEGDGIEFQAGQYVNVHIPGENMPRAFSLADKPASRTLIELNVRRVPGGKGTGYLHEGLKSGDEIRLSGPFGRFFVRKSDSRPVILIAGGSGLSSPKSMLIDMLEEGEERAITLVYGARSRAELYYHELFLDLASRHAHFTYVPALSDEAAESPWSGFRGYVHDAAKAHFNGDFRGHKAYLCGPPVMIEAAIRTLMQGQLFERDIYTEKFLTSADGAEALAKSPLFRSI